MIRRLTRYVRRLREGADAAIECRRHLAGLVRLQLWAEVQTSPHYRDPKRLIGNSFKVYSQGREDGMIDEIFRRIGLASRRFVEIGVEDGLECNTAFLLIQGWSGVWIEASSPNAARAREYYRGYPLEIHNVLVNAENADELVARAAGDDDLDLLSVDVDSNDYWIWERIITQRPRVVIIEYNSTLPAPIRKVVNYPSPPSPNANFFGASLGALVALGEKKGYCLVGCSPEGTNAFFVRSDLVGDHFCAPFTAENHYEPPRYDMIGPSGHRPGMGQWRNV